MRKRFDQGKSGKGAVTIVQERDGRGPGKRGGEKDRQKSADLVFINRTD